MSTDKSTVIASYEPTSPKNGAYQTEAELEATFIKMLTEQGYEYLDIKNEAELITNLRRQLEKLNHYTFSDSEWERFFNEKIAKKGYTVQDKATIIQEDYVQNLEKDDGATANIKLIDKKCIHNNILQVINQYTEKGGLRENRYDVTILVNGLPLVHVELKKRGEPLKSAFNQITRYDRESFWAGSGLYEYAQIFVISNGTDTKYYSNTTREQHVDQVVKKKPMDKFQFTSYWADSKGRTIPDLEDFTRTFFAKHTLLNILTKYCVLDCDKRLMVMRPYQIAAAERIINRIELANYYGWDGTTKAGGYIWHSTGSGKTLTSFKVAQLACDLPYIDKVIFVVDRKDLDSQTSAEFNKFEEHSVDNTKSTKVLQQMLEDKDERGHYKQQKIIVTTIQKLDVFIKKNPSHPIRDKNVVLIFDECHRSQFGGMHSRIAGGTVKKDGSSTVQAKRYFRHYYMFGFTGTPIFEENASSQANPLMQTTAQVFGGEPDKDGNPRLPLHSYTIVNAINDGNVLPFNVQFVNTVKKKDNNGNDKLVAGIDTEEALASPERITAVVKYIIDHFDDKTHHKHCYQLNGEAVNGFNSIFATSSIPLCKKYYMEFKKQLKESGKDLAVAAIFSCSPNEDAQGGIIDDGDLDIDAMDVNSRDFLEMAMRDFNQRFGRNCDAAQDGLQNYYNNVSEMVKKKKIDILLVVNMFLTGFDAATVNTLWVDKNLKQHGLLQAFSRTNRIIDDIKSSGNIVCFRNLEKETNDAIAMFGDERAGGIVLVRPYNDYYFGYTDQEGEKHKGYKELAEELRKEYPMEAFTEVMGEKKKAGFVKLFSHILRRRNVLSVFDEFKGNEIFTPREFQDYSGKYCDIHDEHARHKEKDSILDDIVFEMDIVKSIDINVDYILNLINERRKAGGGYKELMSEITSAIRSSTRLRPKQELIEAFVAKMMASPEVKDVAEEWQGFAKEKQATDEQQLINKWNLDVPKAKKFIAQALKTGKVRTTGADVEAMMPLGSRFNNKGRMEKKEKILEDIKKFVETYSDVA